MKLILLRLVEVCYDILIVIACTIGLVFSVFEYILFGDVFNLACFLIGKKERVTDKIDRLMKIEANRDKARRGFGKYLKDKYGE